jgi:hypothetical protein
LQISIEEKAVKTAAPSWMQCELPDSNVMEGHNGGLDIGPDQKKPVFVVKSRRQASPFSSEAAKALLSSPLPPELIVDFKGSVKWTINFIETNFH